MCSATSPRPTRTGWLPLLDAVADAAPLLARGQARGVHDQSGAADSAGEASLDGLQLRHRRAAQCRQVHAVQRADRDRGGAGGELPVLHHRAECRPGRGARSAAGRAGGDRQVGQDRADQPGIRGHRRAGARRRPRARGSATSSSPTSARWTRSSTCCAASRTPTSTHVEGSIDPIRDAETVETELMLADLDSLEKRAVGLQKRARGGDKESAAQLALIEPIAGRPARWPAGAHRDPARSGAEAAQAAAAADHQARALRLQRRGGGGRDRQRPFRPRGRRAPTRRARARRDRLGGDRGGGKPARPRPSGREFLEGLGLHDSGLDRVIRAGYDLLGPDHLFHRRAEGERAPGRSARGTKAPQAAGAIHGDFERGFIAVRDDRLRRLRGLRRRGGRQGGGQDAGRGQGLRRARRRRAAVPVQRLSYRVSFEKPYLATGT